MKKIIFLLLVVVNLFAEISIVTGSKGGTYYPFGEQIAQVCGDVVGGLNVISTKGSLDNIKRLLKQPDVKFAIVQYDVLLYMKEKAKDNYKIRRAVNNLRIVMPFYDEQIHIITRKDLDLKNVRDLEGLRVSVGSKGGGSYITAMNIQKYGNIHFEIITESLKDSLKSLIRNELDAIIYVAGVPAKMFNANQYNRYKLYKFYKDNITLLSMEGNYELNKIYPLQTISRDDYAWLDYPIRTGAVKSVLITYNYKPNQPSYKRVERLYKCLYENLHKLQTSPRFHKKWKQVNPTNFEQIQWKVHPAVLEFLDSMHAPKHEEDIIDEFFKDL